MRGTREPHVIFVTGRVHVSARCLMRRRVKLELQPNSREGAVARRVASAMLKDDHANAEEAADVELVTSELVTNAVAASSGSDAVQFSMELSEEAIRVSVANAGDVPEQNLTPSKPEDVRGRGLAIVRAIGDVAIEHDDGTTTVSVDIPLSGKHDREP